MIKRILGMLLAVCLLLSMMPVSALAAEEVPSVQPEVSEKSEPIAVQEDAETPDVLESSAQPVEKVSMTYVNPLYADVIRASELVQPGAVALADEVVYCATVEEAGDAVRTQLQNRQETVTVGLQDSYMDKQQLTDVFRAALVHTGVPTAGDYLAWQYGGWSGSIGGYTQNNVYYLTLTYTVTYYTTAAQEAELDAAVSELLSDLELDQKSDYETVKAIYDWICANVTYDDTNLNDEDYKLKYTAYAAMMNHTAVCQGYAVLLYRLLLEEGIDVRVITGDAGGAHAWNIVRLSGRYYNADPTWDAGRSTYSYFLKNMDGFSDHTRSSAYTTEAFNAAYPMGETDFDPNAEPPEPADVTSGACGPNLTWTLDENGLLTISGTGNMEEFGSKGAPWFSHASQVQSVELESGVTNIGNCAFERCSNLPEISIPNSVTQIGTSAFLGCSSLTEITIPDNVTNIGISAFDSCYGLQSIAFGGTVPTIGARAFNGVTANAYYPCINSNWTEADLENYGGTLTWIQTHSFGEWTQTRAASCTEAGEEERTCSLCRISETRAIGSPGHNYTDVVTAPTCTAKGYTTHTCTHCGDSYVDTYVGALDHSYAASVTASTCTERGYTTHTCTRCGDSYVDTYTDALGHTFVDGSCTVCGEKDGVASGTCGENLIWILDDKGTLTISGTGDMTDYSVASPDEQSPWYQPESIRESITSIVIRPGVTSVGDFAFHGCWNVADVEIPDTVTRIGASAFEVCLSLHELEIPASAVSIGAYAFSNCTELETITLHDGLKSIGDQAFLSCLELKEIVVPDSVTAFGRGMFQGCSGLRIAALPGNLTELDGTFWMCSALTSVVIPETVTSIGASTFAACESLEEIAIPSSVTSIGTAFGGCTGLKRITFEGSAPTIGENCFWNVTAAARYPVNDPTWTENVRQNYGGNITWSAYLKDESQGESMPMYRLYNPYTLEHLLTCSAAEANQLISVGWLYDGVAWNSPKTGSPVYRLYNPYDDWHTYTISLEEIDMLTPLGWKVDGVVCFAAPSEDGLPIYRLFNPYEQKNYHLLTASIEERDWLVTLGWKLEGIGWYAEKR